MTPVIIYGPQGSGKTFNAEAFARHYGKTEILDTGMDGRKLPDTIPPNTLALTLEQPRSGDPRTWVQVDDAMRAIGKKPFRLTTSPESEEK